MPRGVYDRKVEVAGGESVGAVEIPTTGDIQRSDLEIGTERIETVTNMNKAEELAFMEELVEIYLHDGQNQNDEPVVDVGVNGVHVYLKRGQNHTLKRKYVLNLATSKPTTYTTAEGMDKDGAKTVHLRAHTAIKYPFAVIRDSQKGMEWLRNIQANR